jgi:MoxR-like ATPase
MNRLPEPFATLFARTASATKLNPDERYAAEAGHTWSDDERRAVIHAWASGRPLLVRGEAGSGKSQLARALAALLGVTLITEVIHPRFEATDLMYREDHVERLGHAQLLSVVEGGDRQTPAERKAWLEQELAPRHFIKKGPLWKAMTEPLKPATAPSPEGHAEWPRAVLLIDEIDKADADVPNALLDVLGNRSLALPTGEVVALSADHPPLIIVTTNEDRELPAAFVRRCAVLSLRPDDASEEAFVQWLSQRAMAHAKLAPWGAAADSPLRVAARQVWADRRAAKEAGLPTVGLAEYLDLLYSLWRLSQGDAPRALELLDSIAPYALVKHREQTQDRPSVPRGSTRDGD